MTLYELSSQAAQLLELLEAGDIDEQTFNDTFEAMGADEKVESCCKVLRQLEADTAMYAAEVERLERAKKSVEANAKRLKGEIYNFYLASGSRKIKAGTFAVSARKSKYLELADDAAIPDEYLKVTVKPDKTAIKAALESGVVIAGAEIKERESVQIR